MKSVLLAAIFSICCAVSASAAALEELTPYLSGQYFTWQEHGGGRRLLKESGPLLSGGILLGVGTASPLTLRARGELFGGEVRYKGETQAPSSIPVNTDVTYLGTRQEFDLGYRLSSGGLRFEPFSGLGYRWWLRELQDATLPTGQRVSGYTETWRTAYLRLGARGRYQAPSGVTAFAEGGARYPFYAGNSIDFAGSGVTTFRPDGKWSGFAETGLCYRRVKLTLLYEGLRFSQSPKKLVGTRQFYQPDSSSDIYGLNLGWAFR